MSDATRAYVEVDGDIQRFVLKKATYRDSGTYTIKASNCYGSQKTFCTVRVSTLACAKVNLNQINNGN